MLAERRSVAGGRLKGGRWWPQKAKKLGVWNPAFLGWGSTPFSIWPQQLLKNNPTFTVPLRYITLGCDEPPHFPVDSLRLLIHSFHSMKRNKGNLGRHELLKHRLFRSVPQGPAKPAPPTPARGALNHILSLSAE